MNAIALQRRCVRALACALLLAPVLVACTHAPVAEADLTPRLDGYLAGVYPPDEPGAVALVVRDGEVVFRRAYGLADIESGERLTPDHVLHIASITKNLTAAAVLQLVERDMVALDDPIADHLDGLPPAWSPITVRHLLTHASGLPEFTEIADIVPSESVYVHHDTILEKVAGLPLRSPPGTDWAYSNTGYLLLGRLLDRYGNQPWHATVTALAAPLGMSDTVYAGHGHPRLAPGHTRRAKVIERANTPTAIPDAAGAMLSTVDDLASWIAALEQGRVLGPASMAARTQRVRLEDGTHGGYGMGWMLTRFGPHDVQWHGGDITGYTSALLRIPERKLVVIVLSNTDRARERSLFVALRLAELTLGEDWSTRAQIPDQALRQLAGVYGDSSGNWLIEAREGRLWARSQAADKPTPLAALSMTEFEGEMGLRLTFQHDAASPAVRLVLRPVMGKERILRRAPVQAGGAASSPEE